jgi:transcriptional regulator with XRE-family HTH domain
MAEAKTPLVRRIDSLLTSQKRDRKELIEAAKVNHGAITNWDKRGTVPAADVALRMADFLGVSIRWLVTGEDEKGYNQDERNLIAKYRCLTDQGQYEVNTLMDAKLTVIPTGESEKKEA